MTQPVEGRAALSAVALASAAQEVLGVAWGCVADPTPANAPAVVSALPAASWYGSVLPLSVNGLPHELRLQATVGVVAGLLPRMLGRTASAEEVDGMAEELLAELVNQVAGHWAGLLGEDGMEVELGIPTALGTGPSSSPTATSAEVPLAATILRWTFAGNPLVLSLSCPGASLP